MGDLYIPPQSSPTLGDLSGRNQPAVSLRVGRAWFLATIINRIANGQLHIGFWPTTTLDNNQNFTIATTASGELRPRIYDDEGAPVNVGRQISLEDTTDYPVALAWFEDGYHAFSKRLGYWFRDWVYYREDASNYGGFSNLTWEGYLKDKFILRDRNAAALAPLVSVESPVIGTGSISGDEAAHSPFEYYMDFVIDSEPSSGSIKIVTNFKDPENYLYFLINSGGITQGECRDGVETDYFVGEREGSNVTIIVALDELLVWTNTNGVINEAGMFMSPNIRNATDWEIADLGVGGAVSNFHIYPYCLREETGLGSNLVVNGDFSPDSDWTGADWDTSGGNADHTGDPTATDALFADVAPLDQLKLYFCQFTASAVTDGYAQIRLGDDASSVYNVGAIAASDGTHSGYGICRDTDDLSIEPVDDFDGIIDDVIVQEVLFKNSELANVLDSLVR
jgi:hypothetical protein